MLKGWAVKIDKQKKFGPQYLLAALFASIKK